MNGEQSLVFAISYIDKVASDTIAANQLEISSIIKTLIIHRQNLQFVEIRKIVVIKP